MQPLADLCVTSLERAGVDTQELSQSGMFPKHYWDRHPKLIIESGGFKIEVSYNGVYRMKRGQVSAQPMVFDPIDAPLPDYLQQWLDAQCRYCRNFSHKLADDIAMRANRLNTLIGYMIANARGDLHNLSFKIIGRYGSVDLKFEVDRVNQKSWFHLEPTVNMCLSFIANYLFA